MSKFNLDEMQEKKLLKIERNGMWFSFWGLLAVIIVQICLGAELKQVAGEWAIFMLLCIYIAISCMKNGIWDRRLKPIPKTNAVISLIAALAVVIIYLIVYYSRFSGHNQILSWIFISSVLLGVFTFFLCFVVLQISSYLYSKRVKKLEQECDEDSIEK